MMKIVNNFREHISNKRWGAVAGYIVVALLAVTLLISVTWVIVNTILANIQILSFIVGGYVLVFYLLYTSRKEKRAKIAEEQGKLDQAVALQKKAKANRNYSDLANVLFPILLPLCDMLSLQRGDSPKSLYAGNGIMDNATFYAYRYQALKRGEVNCDTIKSVLQSEIDNKLESNVLGFSVKKHVFEGATFSILQVLDVSDVGNYVFIDVVLVDDNSASYLLNKQYTTFAQSNVSMLFPRDEDF